MIKIRKQFGFSIVLSAIFVSLFYVLYDSVGRYFVEFGGIINGFLSFLIMVILLGDEDLYQLPLWSEVLITFVFYVAVIFGLILIVKGILMFACSRRKSCGVTKTF